MQRSDASIENAFAALRVDIGRRVTRHRGDDLDFLFGQKFHEPFITWLEQDGKITAIYNFPRRLQCAHALHDVAKVWNHFRRAAGKIDRWNVALGQPIDDAINRFARHDLFALRPGIHMAMHAGKIAKFTDIDLENLRARAAKHEIVLSESRSESVHE